MTDLGMKFDLRHNVRVLLAIGVAAICAMTVGTAGVAAAQQAEDPQAAGSAPEAITAPYLASTANIANPERGFFSGPGDCNANAFNETKLREARRTLKITLVRCIFYLKGYQAKDLDQATLARLRARATTVEGLGLKMVLRFAYDKTSQDAKIEWVERHLNQLAPILREKAHVIHVLESGFVGSYGEGYYTDNYGNAGAVSDAQWVLRKRVVDKVLAVLPATRQTQVRTVYMKSRLYGPTVTQVGPAPNPAAARVGVHNDCFLAAFGDQGTYRNDADRSFLAADSKYVAVGGELCGEPDPDRARTDCSNAKAELAKYRWTHLNKDWGVPVLEKWAAQGCRAEVDRRLGYRLSLVGASFPTSIPRGTTFLGQVIIRNTGWAAPISNRPVQLGLRNTATGSVSYLPFRGATPKTWYPGTSTTLAEQFGVINPGTYELVLRLPDASPALAGPKPLDPLDPEATRYPYNVQLANQGVWDRTNGYNKLLLTLRVT
jgi:hypothetical protein